MRQDKLATDGPPRGGIRTESFPNSNLSGSSILHRNQGRPPIRISPNNRRWLFKYLRRIRDFRRRRPLQQSPRQLRARQQCSSSRNSSIVSSSIRPSSKHTCMPCCLRGCCRTSKAPSKETTTLFACWTTTSLVMERLFRAPRPLNTKSTFERSSGSHSEAKSYV